MKFKAHISGSNHNSVDPIYIYSLHLVTSAPGASPLLVGIVEADSDLSVTRETKDHNQICDLAEWDASTQLNVKKNVLNDIWTWSG